MRPLTPAWKMSALAGCLVVTCVAVGPPPHGAAEPSRSLPPDNPLQRHRQAATSGTSTATPVQGWVTAAEHGVITVSFVSKRLAEVGLADQDLVTLRLGSATLTARLLSVESYDVLMSDDAARALLDVDVVAVIDGELELLIVGLSSDLVEWLRPRPGSPITVRRR